MPVIKNRSRPGFLARVIQLYFLHPGRTVDRISCTVCDPAGPRPRARRSFPCVHARMHGPRRRGYRESHTTGIHDMGSGFCNSGLIIVMHTSTPYGVPGGIPTCTCATFEVEVKLRSGSDGQNWSMTGATHLTEVLISIAFI